MSYQCISQKIAEEKFQKTDVHASSDINEHMSSCFRCEVTSFSIAILSCPALCSEIPKTAIAVCILVWRALPLCCGGLGRKHTKPGLAQPLLLFPSNPQKSRHSSQLNQATPIFEMAEVPTEISCLVRDSGSRRNSSCAHSRQACPSSDRNQRAVSPQSNKRHSSARKSRTIIHQKWKVEITHHLKQWTGQLNLAMLR